MEVEAFEDELHGRRDQGRIALRVKLPDRRGQAADFRRLRHVLQRRHRVRHLDAQAVLEVLDHLLYIGHREMAVEDVERGPLDQLLDDLLLAGISNRLQLDLAAGRRQQRRQVAHARRHLALAVADRTAQGVGLEALEVADRDADADARALRDVRAAAGEVGNLGDDLLHVGRHDGLELSGPEVAPLLLHDVDLVRDRLRVVGPNLRTEAVLQRRDDPATIGVVLGVGARHHEQVQIQADLVAANLNVALLHDVELAERIQVGLLNIMEERDGQVRGYKVRLPLDLFVVASANPEDYTNRGRIITPLKDRFGSQIRTHYPKALEHEIAIMDQEGFAFPTDGHELGVPFY